MSDLQDFSALGSLGRPYRHLWQTQSTQNEAKALAEAGVGEGALVVAENQSAGRGRQGRPWQTQPGSSLIFSLLLRPQWPHEQLPLLSLAAAVALRQSAGVGGLKWPNDWLAPDGRKLAGVLLEAHFGAGQLAYVILGVGINVKQAPQGASHVQEWVAQERPQLLQGFLVAFEQLYQNPTAIVPAWRAYSYTLGRQVQAGDLRGLAADLGPDGTLWLEVDGRLQAVRAGDVEWVGRL